MLSTATHVQCNNVKSFLSVALVLVILCMRRCSGTPALNPDIVESWASPQNGYDRYMIPRGNGALNVLIHLRLFNIAYLEELTTEHSLHMILDLSWNDYRLAHNNSKQVILGDRQLLRKVWYPSVTVLNNKEPGLITDPEKDGHMIVRIHSDGTVTARKTIHLRAFCKMEFKSYPFDKQQCRIIFESASVLVDELVLHWRKTEPVTIDEGFRLYGFKLDDYFVVEEVQHYPSFGNFSTAVLEIRFKREFGTSFIDVYIPTGFFVVMSWLTFWIDVPAAPARVMLATTSMLTLVTVAKNSREKLPELPYIHSLDIWNFICICFVFASLVEYAAVNYIYNKDKRSRKRRAQNLTRSMSVASFNSGYNSDNGPFFKIADTNHSPKPETVTMSFEIPSSPSKLQLPQGRTRSCSVSTLSGFHMSKEEPMDTANKVDRYCRVLFPIGFLLVNSIYWSYVWFSQI